MEFETYEDVIDSYNLDNQGYSTLTDYIKGNNIKYILREAEKGGDDDIGKARWYLNRFFDYVKGKLNAS